MRTLAAILVETARPLVLAELEVPDPGPGQVLVEVAYAAVCHTQVLEVRGHRGPDPYLPHCLGHEGSGRVRSTGEGVRKVRPGDPVLLSWMRGSGAEAPGAAYAWEGRRVNAGGITTFGRLMLISENRLTVLPAGFPLLDAALFGCAVPTGAGAVLNTARAGAGQSLAVFGAGGVGLSAVAAAAMVGCRPVVAVDLREARLEAARAAGATDLISARDRDPLGRLRELCPGGLDLAIEATGRPAVMAQALSAVRPRGGAAVVVGNARAGERLDIDPRELNQGKRLLGTWGGDNDPDRDFPRYLEAYRQGRLAVGGLLTEPYPLRRIDAALDDLESGACARPLVDLSLE